MLPKVAFISTHNAQRSQIAQALARYFAKDAFVSLSGVTEIKERISSDAVRLLKEMYGIDIDEEQNPKLISELPPVDIVIAAGCGEACPFLPCRYMEHWDFEESDSQGDDGLRELISAIKDKVLDLKDGVISGVVFEEVLF